MAYLLIDNFAAGLDTRKSPITAPPGTLRRLVNAVITPGGEIQKRRAFVPILTLTGTFGLAATENNLYAFTRNTDVTPPAFPVAGLGLIYQKIPNSSATLVQSDVDNFDGKIYLVGSDPAGGTAALKNPHYYNAIETQGSGKGYYVRSYQSKVYSVSGKNLSFSAVGDPANWTTGTGAGFINISLQDADSEFLTSLEVYYNKLAIFSSEATQIWAVDPDPLQNAFEQLLRGSGTISPRSTLQYGSGDVLYLDSSGIRSVKAKDSSNSGSVSDIGSPIDALIQTIKTSLGESYLSKAIAMLEPLVGRFWMIFPNEIYVLSYFPGPKITAWSRFTLTFTVDHAVSAGGRIFLRSGNTLYLYGGLTNTEYDNCGVEVRLPFLDNKKPGHNKIYEAFDASVKGTWRVSLATNINSEDTEEDIANLTESTWGYGRVEAIGYASHFSLRFYNNDANLCELYNCALHFQQADDEQ